MPSGLMRGRTSSSDRSQTPCATLEKKQPISDGNSTPKDVRVLSRGAAYQFTLGDKLAAALSAVRQRLFPRPILVAGPYVGEFGHELMEWQAVVRARVSAYDQVHVITYPGRDYLYSGCVMHYHDLKLEKTGYRFGRFTPRQLAQLAHAHARAAGLCNYDVLGPWLVCSSFIRRWIWREQFARLAEPPVGGRLRDLAFHFRNVDKEGPDRTRNYPLDLAEQLVRLCQQQGYEVCCIGHPNYSFCPAGVEDLRAVDLRASVAALCSARLLVGELSGPMHLAQLCCRPILIWADGQWRIETCLRWNVFQSPVFVLANDTFRPEPQRVKTLIDETIRQLRPAK